MLTSIDDPFLYNPKILEFFGIPENSLLPIKNNLDDFGAIKRINIPITCSLGDQQSSFFGNFVLTKGWNCKPKLTIGTGSFFITTDYKGK